MRVLVIGEGNHEESALPILVRLLNGLVSETEFDRIKNIRRTVHGKGSRILKRAVSWSIEAQSRGFDALVLLMDEDGDASRRQAIDEAQSSPLHPIPRACGVAIRTFDAWFLADEHAISSVLARTVHRQPDPERQRNPKGSCTALLAGSEIESLSEFYQYLATAMNLDATRERCPNGFRPFADRIAMLTMPD